MGRRHEDGLCADSVHVDAHSGLKVVQVNVAVLCDQINDAVLAADLGGGGIFTLSTPLTKTYEYQVWSRPTCIATGKSVWASGGKNTSTAFLVNGWFPVAG